MTVNQNSEDFAASSKAGIDEPSVTQSHLAQLSHLFITYRNWNSLMEIASGVMLHRSWIDEFNTSFQVQSAFEGKPVDAAVFYLCKFLSTSCSLASNR